MKIIERWWAANTDTAARALLAVTQHARVSEEVFEFSPWSVSELLDAGLQISWSKDSYPRALLDTLDAFPGLVRDSRVGGKS